MPAAYKRVAGKVMTAQLLDYKLYQDRRSGRISPAQKAGLAYEAKVLAGPLFDLEAVIYHPALKFRSKQRLDEHCIPDAIALNDRGDIVTIIEIKSTHNFNAWNQLHNLYLPVVKAIWPEKHINLLEICKEYNPGITLPGRSEIVDDLASWVEKAHTSYGVYPWSGR